LHQKQIIVLSSEISTLNKKFKKQELLFSDTKLAYEQAVHSLIEENQN
jgi:hypothetical protein